MQDIVHCSFDLWLTLIKSNPNYKIKRIEYFHKNYNHLNLSLVQVADIFQKVDIECNVINELTGGQFTTDQILYMVLANLNPKEALSDIDVAKIKNDLDTLFFEFQPMLISKSVGDVLYYLKEKRSVTLNILSNTAFIHGSLLRLLLNNLGIGKWFDFQIYSDEVKVSKPSFMIFNIMYEEVRKRNGSTEKHQILHIGDSENADLKGAKNFGIQSLLIDHKNDQDLNTILSYV